jgi:hypothetical protein
MNLIQTFVQQAIQDHPADAAREVPEIIGHYIADNTRLNRFYQDVKRLAEGSRPISKEGLARLIAAVEGWPQIVLFDEVPK